MTVTAEAPQDAVTSSAEAQLPDRKNAAVISDNLGAQEMKTNADCDAAAAMSRVTGLSVVDTSCVRARPRRALQQHDSGRRGLPTTEPDKKVVPLDLFPAGLLDSVQVTQARTRRIGRRNSLAASCRSSR